MNLKKRNIIIAIMVAMFLAAFEGTVVTTAMPTITKDLSGFELISWVFSLYLLTSAISTPIYGKLADLYGRKNVLSVGIVIFLVGSALCGLSQNMYQLIVFRGLQGIGAGSILTVTFTIVGDIFELGERAKVQGWLSTVWGIASLVGPFIGGFLIDNLSWNWIFYINVPFGILSIILLQKNLHESFEKKKHKIDYPGIGILTFAIVAFLYGVLSGGENYHWSSPSVILCFVLTAIFLIIFYFLEKKAVEPIVPFDIFTRESTIVNSISFLVAGILMGVEAYMPIYIQNVLGFRATISGLTMAPMSIAWITSAFILSKAIPKYGEKLVIALSIAILVVSSGLLPTLSDDASLLLVLLYIFVMGFGFGGCFTTLTIMVQSSVNYHRRGAATAANALVRTLGQTIGVSIFGSILNRNIVEYFDALGIAEVDPGKLYTVSSMTDKISPEHIRLSVYSGVHAVFMSLIFIMILCLLLSFMLSNRREEHTT
ncbi:MDR family MFS transporter [Clostridiaceae bacterium 35-E11]